MANARIVALGLVAGVVSGLLGVGGGIVMVPGLVLIAGMAQHRAHGTSLAAMIPIAAVGAVAFVVAGHIDYPLAGLLALGAVAGAPLGVRFMSRIPEAPLRLIFAGVMIVAAARIAV